MTLGGREGGGEREREREREREGHIMRAGDHMYRCVSPTCTHLNPHFLHPPSLLSPLSFLLMPWQVKRDWQSLKWPASRDCHWGQGEGGGAERESHCSS